MKGCKKMSAATVVGDVFEKRVEKVFVLLPGLWLNAVANGSAFNRALYETSSLQLFQVLRDRSLSEAQFFNEVAAYASIDLDQMLQDGNPRRMRNRLCHRRNLVLALGEQFGFRQSHFIAILR